MSELAPRRGGEVARPGGGNGGAPARRSGFLPGPAQGFGVNGRDHTIMRGG